jgi:hypothetical protein
MHSSPQAAGPAPPFLGVPQNHTAPPGRLAVVDRFDRIYQLHRLLAGRRVPIPLAELRAGPGNLDSPIIGNLAPSAAAKSGP